jgi:AcrR family transcriptional regulator
MARPARPEHEIEHLRQHILDAASRVFASHGFEAASIEEIAREAGYGASTLYGYFKGKQAIVSAIMERFFEDQESVFEMVLPAGLSLRQSLELLVRRQLELLEPRRAGLVFLSQRGVPEVEGFEAYRDRETALHAHFSAWVEAHARPGDLGKYSAEMATRRLNGLILSELFHWVRDDSGIPLADRVPEILDFFFHGVGSSNA